jgi:Right handed beta helix region
MTIARPAILAASIMALAAAMLIAGPLSPPPGPVASTYKTLVEIEPRIAINAINTPGDAQHTFIITAPGSYYLTQDVVAPVGKHGIGIASHHVTIDFNGFSLIGPGIAPAVVGVAPIGDHPRNLVLRNGTIRDFAYGMLGAVHDSLFENLAVIDNNAGAFDLNGASNTIFRNCRVETIAEAGIFAGDNALVQNCTVKGGSAAITVVGGGVIEGCTVTGSGGGIHLQGGGVVRACSVTGSVFGITITNGGLVESCSVYNCSTMGVQVSAWGTVRNCVIVQAPIGIGDWGIVLGRTTIDSNTISECPVGIKLIQSGSTVVRNTFHHCTTAPIQAVAGNSIGTVMPSPVGAAAWDNIAN